MGRGITKLINKVKSNNMTKKEFTQTIANGKFGVWTLAAKIALDEDKVDEYVGYWLEQDASPGAHNTIKRLLEGELYTVLQAFKAEEQSICVERCDKFPSCEPCGSHFRKMEDSEVWFVMTEKKVVIRVCSSQKIATMFRNRAYRGYYKNCIVEQCTENIDHWRKMISDIIPLEN